MHASSFTLRKKEPGLTVYPVRDSWSDRWDNDATLTHAVFDGKRLGAENAVALAAALKHNTRVERIDADKNNFGDLGVLAIADALRVNKTLKVITLIGAHQKKKILSE